MPQTSLRARVIKGLLDIFMVRMNFAAHRYIFNAPNAFEDEFDDEVMITYIDAITQRYHQRGSYKQYDTKDWEVIVGDEENFSHAEFLLFFRVERDSFHMLVDLIKNHEVFQRRMGPIGYLYKNQAPVQLQLLVFLFVVGSFGSDVNYKKAAKRFEISQGTVRLYVTRIQIAILHLEEQVVRWPDADERRIISTRILQKYGFPNCVGSMDGTYLNLVWKPTLHHENYKTRKGPYALNALIICDDESRVLYHHLGWPGSTHDNRVWKNSLIYQNYDQYFSEVEYVIADSAYTCDVHCIPAYKRSRNAHVLPAERIFFNTRLARPRVKSEHTNSLLKNRFQWLKSIPIIIKDRHSLIAIIKMVKCCIILHNMLIGTPVPEEWYNNEEELEEPLPDEHELMQPCNEAYTRREQIRQYLIENAGGMPFI